MPSLADHWLSLSLALALLVSGCERTHDSLAKVNFVVGNTGIGFSTELAVARIDAAKDQMPDHALALLVSALKINPHCEEARAMAVGFLEKVAWNWPLVTIDHHLPVDQIEFSPPSSLWVSLSGTANTSIRWNLESLSIESVLFPRNEGPTRGMVFDDQHQFVVIQRGPVTLLCNAQTLKPICDLGLLPDFITPAASIVFSTGGVLIAHPAYVSESDRSIVWQIRDVATGRIVRSSDPFTPGSPLPLAASLNRTRLRVLLADGSLMEMPLSPIKPIVLIPAKNPAEILQAQFATQGNSALILRSYGTHLQPVLDTLDFTDDSDKSLTPSALIDHFAWTRQPCIWNGLLANPDFGKIKSNEKSIELLTRQSTPLRTQSKLSAAAFHGDLMIVADTAGQVTVNHLLPLPAKLASPAKVDLTQPGCLGAIEQLSKGLTGIYYDDAQRKFVTLTPSERLQALTSCDRAALLFAFPTLDFKTVIAAAKSTTFRTASPQSMIPLWDRLVRADATEKTWPKILELSTDLTDSQWHRDLTAAIVGKLSENPPVLPWNSQARLSKIFLTGDSKAVLAAIEKSGTKGPAATAALSLALASSHPEWIAACLKSAEDMPPILRQIARSQIALLEGHKAEALTPWPEKFPTLDEIRETQNWEAWEQADFSPALERIRKCLQDELTAAGVPKKSTPEQRRAVADHLRLPETYAALGPARFATACLDAALAMSAFKEDKETTFQLAAQARQLGAPPEPCLRAEALALTALGDYKGAHSRWIELITEHPLATQKPSDYAEAAYTAFENANPHQAMEILTTGVHRYPSDAAFALRAGWVALLTGNSARAYQFLQVGQRIGYPADKLENAMALLTIAAAQTGAADDAKVYFKDLVHLSPDWKDPRTIEGFDWPEELKETLRQFYH
jgi:tetratricopeptide (TPR) repeat protein